jgi:hypothetical protein
VRHAHPVYRDTKGVLDTALGLLVTGVRAGRTVSAVAIAPARAAYRSPLGAPWRAMAGGLAIDGASTRRALQERGEAALERALAGPLTEHVGRLLGEHRVVERLAQELTAQGTVTALVDQALEAGLADEVAERLLEHERTEALVARALESPGLERVLVRVLDSRVLVELTDRVLRSPEMQQVIAHIASSPELRSAMAEQSAGLAEEMVAGVRSRSQAMDDLAERTVRGWLRRPRPRPA